MKKSSKIALCGVLSAMSVMLMLFSYFPYLTLAIPAVAGLVFVILVIEIDSKWAFLAFLSSAVLVAFLAEADAKIMYIAFFGYYPILKERLERLRRPALEYLLKFLVFNAVMVSVYTVMIKVFGMPLDEMGDFGKWTVLVMLVVGNITFLLYDYAVSGMIAAYMRVLHPKLKKLIK